MHTQAFRKISQLVIFKLSSCDLSPPLEPLTSESSNVHKMSYTHPNLIRQWLWVLGCEKKRWEKTHFEIFRSTNCEFSISSPISQNWNILISTHPIVKLKIVLESLWSREDMVKNPFWDSKCFTSENPCDSSPPPRRNHEPGTPSIGWRNSTDHRHAFKGSIWSPL